MPVPLQEPRLYHSGLETTLRGVEHRLSDSGAPILQFLGIKYASIPARFRQSQLFTSYPPITDATRHGPICPQRRSSKSAEETLFGIPQEEIPVQNLKQDEFECLNLNITCPAGLTPQSRIPVMLWVHGGGDKGSGSEWFYDAGGIVRKGITYNKPVIVVTFNFRIGLLGFATSPIIRDDNKAAGEEGTGNYGLRDQRKAMEWVYHYISEFGGDPSNITLVGAGSGAADIVCHLVSRLNETQPLFHRAIIQSAVFEPTLPDISSAGWHLSRVMSALQVSSIEKFRRMEVDKLLGLGQTLRAVDDGVFFREGWQNYFSPETMHAHHHYWERMGRTLSLNVASTHFAGVSAHSGKRRSRSRRSRSRSLMDSISSSSRSTPPKIDAIRPLFPESPQHPNRNLQPLIIGDCSADALLWSYPISYWTSAGVVRRLKAICQSLSKTTCVLRAYDITSCTPDDEIADRVLELVGDARVAWPTHCVAENAKQERGGHGVWRYVFDQEGSIRGVPHHAADLMYLFDNVPLPASVCGTAGAVAFYDGPYDVSDEESEKELAVSCATGPRDGPLDLDGLTQADFSKPSAALAAAAAATTKSTDALPVSTSTSSSSNASDDSEGCWLTTIVDEYSYNRVRDTMQERWLSFAQGETPWREDRVFVFGPEGETGERSMEIFNGRRRRGVWKDALEPLGPALVQKFGVELSRGPALGADRAR